MNYHDEMPEVVLLNSGHKMLTIALGTAGVLPPLDVLTSIFVDAMEVGYRHFDTAPLYGSESSLGAAIREALRRGIIASRDELFVTTKLWCTDADPPLVLPAIKKSLWMDSPDEMPEVVLLNSGHKMPVIALGTGGDLPPPDVLTSIFVDAMEVGYRHFDTASLYRSESSLGAAVREALRRGIIASRDELFVTTKLWCTDADPPLVLPAIKKSLQMLGLEYVDLYLVHWPVRVMHGTEGFDYRGKMLPFDFKGTWAAMEECSGLGLAKSIGVSNFSSRKLSQILDDCTIPPAVNQVEMNIAWQQKKLREFCKEKGIYVSAWSPLGANGARWGSLAVMESRVMKEIADARGTTVAQVALKWVHEQGAIVIVKSFNKERMKENLKIFDWKMTEHDLEKIKGIPQRRGFSGELFVDAVNGPYKSAEELFDNDS